MALCRVEVRTEVRRPGVLSPATPAVPNPPHLSYKCSKCENNTRVHLNVDRGVFHKFQGLLSLLTWGLMESGIYIGRLLQW